ncbi:hypothetical protein AB6A40_006065 [Gnathostoma spinigerum]|uniref:Annexin n=1 Tax=Gnathostoma spinigerum TaxID=75299 RepID=A0ABD6EHZ0_9BILA
MPLMYQLFESQELNLQGTVIGPEDDDFHPELASERLQKALGGIQTDEKVLIDVTVAHTNFQRQKIMESYQAMFERDLLVDLADETGGYLYDILKALYTPSPVFTATLIHHSISDANVEFQGITALEIVSTHTTKQMRAVREAYQMKYKKTPEKDIARKVDGLFGKMLQSLFREPRDENDEVNNELLEKQVTTICSAPGTIEELGRSLSLFEEVFAGTSWNHISTLVSRLEDELNAGKSIENLLRRNQNMHGDIRQMLIVLVKISRNIQTYFAEKLHEAISADWPDYSVINNTIVLRCEIDLFDICNEYRREFRASLLKDLQMVCSGEYFRVISRLLPNCFIGRRRT